MIFRLRQLQEKAVKQQKALCSVFIDFSKAYDTVDRETIWKVLEAYGCPDRVIIFIRPFHDGMMGKEVIGGDISDAFDNKHGMKQGFVLAPTLFTLHLAAVVETMGNNLTRGVYLRTSTDRKLFNLTRLKVCTKTREVCVRELLCADDSALVAFDPEDIPTLAVQ